MNRRTLLFPIILLASACGADDPLATGGSDGQASAAGGANRALEVPGEYRSETVTEAGAPRALVADTVISIRFADGQIDVDAGCNRLGGRYSLDDDVLVVDEGLISTELGCDPERHAQDEWLAGFLAARPRVTIGNQQSGSPAITLATDDTTIDFVDRSVADPDVALIGTMWEVTGFIDGDVAMSGGQPRDRAGTLVFGEDGFVTGYDGCNEFGFATDVDGLRHEVDADRITFSGTAVQTLVKCEDEDYETRFRAVLTATVSWAIEASTLTMMADDGRGVTYRVAGQAP